MARYKLNRLHLHLSDDQGWRISTRDYPERTEYGGKGHIDTGEEGGHGGFDSPEEYAELIEHARSQFVEIVPEIDLPGHSYAALASIASLNCDDGENIRPSSEELSPPKPPALYSGIGVGFSSLCLTGD